jgi:hypothetical protein
VSVGQSAMVTVTVNSLNGFTGTVTLSDAPLPSGLSCTAINPAYESLFSSPLNATFSCSATTAGTFNVTVTGSSDPRVHHVSVEFTFTSVAAAAPLPNLPLYIFFGLGGIGVVAAAAALWRLLPRLRRSSTSKNSR